MISLEVQFVNIFVLIFLDRERETMITIIIEIEAFTT